MSESSAPREAGIQPFGIWRLTEPPTPRVGGVYFVQAVTGGLIKVGRSGFLASRLWDLQSGCPIPLCCLGFLRLEHGDVRCAYEEEMHVRFADARAHGEWFEPTEDLVAVANGHRSAWTWLPAHLRHYAPGPIFAEPWHVEVQR